MRDKDDCVCVWVGGQASVSMYLSLGVWCYSVYVCDCTCVLDNMNILSQPFFLAGTYSCIFFFSIMKGREEE